MKVEAGFAEARTEENRLVRGYAGALLLSYYYDCAGDDDPATGTLHLKLVSTGADWEELVVEPLTATLPLAPPGSAFYTP
jgi:hypothetical protein